MSQKLFNQSIALEHLYLTIEQYEDATEAFGFVIKIFDVFTRLVNNLKVTLNPFRKSFKRSELRAYHESHVMMLSQLFKSKTFDASLQVPIPHGMKVSYIQATTVLEELYKTLDIETTINALSVYFTNVSAAGHILPTSDTLTTISKVTKDSVESQLRQVFTNDKTLEVPVGTVFSSFDEIKTVDTHILTYETIFQKVSDIYKKLESIEDIIDTLITGLEKQQTIDKPSVQALYQLVLTASIQLDMFGVLLAEFQRIEHNFVLVLKKMIMSV